MTGLDPRINLRPRHWHISPWHGVCKICSREMGGVLESRYDARSQPAAARYEGVTQYVKARFRGTEKMFGMREGRQSYLACKVSSTRKLSSPGPGSANIIAALHLSPRAAFPRFPIQAVHPLEMLVLVHSTLKRFHQGIVHKQTPQHRARKARADRSRRFSSV